MSGLLAKEMGPGARGGGGGERLDRRHARAGGGRRGASPRDPRAAGASARQGQRGARRPRPGDRRVRAHPGRGPRVRPRRLRRSSWSRSSPTGGRSSWAPATAATRSASAASPASPSLSLLLNAGHWVFAALVNVLFAQRLRDPFTMYKVFRRDCLTGLDFRCDRFDFDIELLVLLLRKGYRPLEIPVSYRSRSFREGKKVSIWRDPWTWLIVLARLRLTRFDPLAQVAGRAPALGSAMLPAGAGRIKELKHLGMLTALAAVVLRAAVPGGFLGDARADGRGGGARRPPDPPSRRARRVPAEQHHGRDRRAGGAGRGLVLPALGRARGHRADPALDGQARPLRREHALALRPPDGERRLPRRVPRRLDRRARGDARPDRGLQPGLVRPLPRPRAPVPEAARRRQGRRRPRALRQRQEDVPGRDRRARPRRQGVRRSRLRASPC